ncbi:MAG: zinc-binding dehydrogenase, partial [Chloroflexota bacterium]
TLSPILTLLDTVTGCGTIGLLACYVLSAYGLRNISAVDAVEARQDLALALGARVATSPTEVKNQDTLYDLGIECSSFQDAFALLQTKMKLNGKIAILSDGNREPLVLLPDFHAKELTLFGSSDGWNYAKHAEWFFDSIRSSSKPIEKIFDVTIGSQEIASTFAALANDELRSIKVFITDF